MTAAAPAIIILLNSFKKRKRSKKIWSKPWLLKRQVGLGVLHMLENELKIDDPESYRQFFRMCSDQFDELLQLIKSDITKKKYSIARKCFGRKQVSNNLLIFILIFRAIIVTLD